MTTATIDRRSSRKEEHLRFLEQLQTLPLMESCCEICHCDCYNSHRSSSELDECRRDDSAEYLKQLGQQLEQLESSSKCDSNNNKTCVEPNQRSKQTHTKRVIKTKKKKIPAAATTSHPQAKHAKSNQYTSKTPEPTQQTAAAKCLKRSRSANSMRSQQTVTSASIHNMRDCKILQELMTSLEDTTTTQPKLEVLGRRKKSLSISDIKSSCWPNALDNNSGVKSDANLPTLKLCESMASLCLSPSVRQAFHTVPTHDKRILNRMATKRSERATAKENAWLARKYWENERYERELLKCEEMDEYKKAVRDKQFQDYLQTKARLNEIAQRDHAELQRLRATLQHKDERAKRRLDAVRTERGIIQCQRRCAELSKCEAVNVQQEEQQLDDSLRKKAICQRLSERLERADQLRTQMLESYLKRVRYDNYLEQLLHEEKWREAQRCEQQKREQLKEHISRKRTKSQRFVENRQRKQAALTHTAKISASLRELVRNSVTPESAIGGVAASGGFTGTVPLSLGRLLFDGPRPISKLSMQ